MSTTVKRYRRQLKQGRRVKADANAWKDGLEDDIAFLGMHDPKGLKFALNHTPPRDMRRKWIVFYANVARLRLRAETDEEAKLELARVLAAFTGSLRETIASNRKSR